MLSITDKGLETAMRMRDQSGEDYSRAGLRVKVEGGGCSGFQYNLSFDHPADDDIIFDIEFHDEEVEEEFYLLVDKRSYLYVAGSEINYHDGLMGNGFVVSNPKANSTCGCGESFSI